MKITDLRDVLGRLVELVADEAPPGWGAWLIRREGTHDYEVSSLMTSGSRPGLCPGEELVLWVEIKPDQAPDFPEAWGDLEILEPLGLNLQDYQDYADLLEEVRGLLAALEERAESDLRAAEALKAFYSTARRALLWQELADKLKDDPELGVIFQP